MTKKIFAQPELMVVNMKRNDIVTASSETISFGENYNGSSAIEAAGRRMDDWDAGY